MFIEYIAMAVIHVLFGISVQRGAKFLARGVGGNPPPHAYSWIHHWVVSGEISNGLETMFLEKEKTILALGLTKTLKTASPGLKKKADGPIDLPITGLGGCCMTLGN